MGDRPRVVVSVTASVDGRVTVGRDRLLLTEEAGQLWRSLWPEGFTTVDGARTALLESLYAPTAILEGSGTFVTVDSGPLELPEATSSYDDFLPDDVVNNPGHRKWFTVVDGRGRVLWTEKGGEGIDLLVITSRSTPMAYLAYLRRKNIPYLVAGEERVDLELALRRMSDRLGVTCVVSEAGGGLNGALLRADLVDELHLILFPAAIGGAGVPTVFDGPELEPGALPTQLRLLSSSTTTDGVVSLRYEVAR
ncbi:RibD family protein [Kribbella jiaozuonensis]|uniref:RibD family protein n=1 Tax=Kribbella jiaozuonensis TaxID=2575441 RepID=A0A4U3LYR4_9ACTN|nr:dihydrofolate reductase family protein [Kribbella jiaozuonensis]TKK81341.1 RibD family protein [Kribbella jiaozuonensis]